MIQHPIPQNISAYQFHLIGDITLKQFFILITGIGIAILVSQTNLFLIIKLGIIILSLMLGVVGAFLPIEERPLDQWFAAFIKAIYRPSQFIWKRPNTEPNYFTFTTSPANLIPVDTPDMAAQAIKRKREGLKSFLQTLPEQKLINTLEQQELNSVDSIANLFAAPTPLTAPQAPVLKSYSQPATLTSPTPQTAIEALPHLNTNPLPSQTPIRPSPKTIEVVPLKPVIVEHIQLPKTQTTTPVPAASPANAPQPQPQSNNPSSPIIPRAPAIPQAVAQTDATLPFPTAPSTPNTVVGMILDKSGKIVDNAIVEIRDTNHMPVRATKSNKLGQFFSTTPLKNGTYEIEVEKSGHSFPLIKLEAAGKALVPLKIQASA
jgi:hypothetical protein